MAPVSIFHQARSYSGMRSLVTVVAIAVTVLETFTVIPAVQLAVTEPRVVVLRGSLIGTKVLKISVPVPRAVVAAFFGAFVVARVQRGLPQVERTAPVWVTIPVAVAAILIAIAALRVCACAQADADSQQ